MSTSTSVDKHHKIKIYVSTSTDALFNIATEDWLFREGDITYQTLYLWRNSPVVVIGKHQNPFKECHLQRMEEDGVVLARRYSGGGAVYQDLGNTCFTFLSSTPNHNKDFNSSIIINALQHFGVKAEASGRNDILVNGLKISGSAYKLAPPRAMHHGTLMIDVNLNALGKYLNPNKAKLLSKGVTSVISRVHNLRLSNSDISHDALSNALIKEFKKAYHNDCEIETLDTSKLSQISSLNSTYEKLKDWNWRFGATPDFNHHMETRFDWGIMDVHINSSEGVINDVKIFSDALFPTMIDDISVALKGVRYNAEAISGVLEKVAEKNKGSDVEKYVLQFKQWIVANM